MRGLLLKDLALMKGQKKFLLLVILIAAVPVLTSGNIGFLTTYLPFVICFFTISTVSYDEIDNSISFLMTLPVSRKRLCQRKICLRFAFGTGNSGALSAFGSGSRIFYVRFYSGSLFFTGSGHCRGDCFVSFCHSSHTTEIWNRKRQDFYFCGVYSDYGAGSSGQPFDRTFGRFQNNQKYFGHIGANSSLGLYSGRCPGFFAASRNLLWHQRKNYGEKRILKEKKCKKCLTFEKS